MKPVSSKARTGRSLSAIVGILALCCGQSRPFERQLVPPEQVAKVAPDASPILKAHMRDGSLYVLSSWSVNDKAKSVSGTGEHLGVDRGTVRTGWFNIPFSEVALFETNKPEGTSSAFAAMLVVTLVSVAVTVACLANPKACFGSCPTFYVSDGDKPLLAAEGFSDAIAPSLETTDIDALFRARPSGRKLEVRMTNEALETHVVRSVDVLAVPRPSGGRVFHSDSEGFFGASSVAPPSACDAPEGSCRQALDALDGRERVSRTDEHDLGAREDVTLTFDGTGSSSPGLVIGARQTLLTTYLLYQALAYLGTEAVPMLSALERNPSVGDRVKAAYRVLGGIEVQVEKPDGAWHKVGEVLETGPIATDVHLVRLPPLPPGPARVRLNMTRGNWRLDWVGLAQLGPRLDPVRMQPSRVVGKTSAGRGVTPGKGETIVTLPGDAYTFSYDLPEHPERYELFLAARGYYLEWMRKEWLADQSMARAALLLYAPSVALKLMAPAFKRQEADMERMFWESRYAPHD